MKVKIFGALLLGIFLLATQVHNQLQGTSNSGWTFLKNEEEAVPALKKPAQYSIIYNRYDEIELMLSMLT